LCLCEIIAKISFIKKLFNSSRMNLCLHREVNEDNMLYRNFTVEGFDNNFSSVREKNTKNEFEYPVIVMQLLGFCINLYYMCLSVCECVRCVHVCLFVLRS